MVFLRKKARLVTRGFQHEDGYDYDETFAHMAHMTTIRALLMWYLFATGLSLSLMSRMSFLMVSCMRRSTCSHHIDIFPWWHDLSYLSLSLCLYPSCTVWGFLSRRWMQLIFAKCSSSCTLYPSLSLWSSFTPICRWHDHHYQQLWVHCLFEGSS